MREKNTDCRLQLYIFPRFRPISFAVFPKIATMCGYRMCVLVCVCVYRAVQQSPVLVLRVTLTDAMHSLTFSLKVVTDDLTHTHYHRSPDMTRHWWRWGVCGRRRGRSTGSIGAGSFKGPRDVRGLTPVISNNNSVPSPSEKLREVRKVQPLRCAPASAFYKH